MGLMKQLLALWIMIALPTQIWAAPHPVELRSNSSPHYFFWDSGTSASKVDSGDIIVDVSKSCNLPLAQVNMPGLIANPIPANLEPQGIAETKEVLREFSFSGIEDKFIQTARVFDHFHGKGSELIVLLPEVHWVLSPQAVSRHRNLQVNRSRLVEQMIERAHLPRETSILNLREGIEGSKIPEIKEAVSLEINEIDFTQLAEAGYPSTFVGLNHIKSKRFPILSAYIESSQLIGAEFLLGLGSYRPGKSFLDTVTEGELYYGEFPNKKSLKKEFAKIQAMSEKKLAHLRTTICQSRGEQMVLRALALANKQKASLVFLTYGSLHHHEITHLLKSKKKSFVTLMGLSSI